SENVMGAVPGARAVLEYDPVQLLGVVTQAGSENTYTVRCDNHDWQGERAASCLLSPQEGDTVLISGPVPSQVFLIAVIYQANPDASHLEVQGDLMITARDGEIALQADRSLHLQAADNASLKASKLDMSADEAS